MNPPNYVDLTREPDCKSVACVFELVALASESVPCVFASLAWVLKSHERDFESLACVSESITLVF